MHCCCAYREYIVPRCVGEILKDRPHLICKEDIRYVKRLLQSQKVGVGEDVEKLESLLREGKMMQPSWKKTVWLLKTLNIEFTLRSSNYISGYISKNNGIKIPKRYLHASNVI